MMGFEKALEKHAKTMDVLRVIYSEVSEEGHNWVRVEDAVAVHRLQLAELLKNRPRKKKRPLLVKGYGELKTTPIFSYIESELDKFFEELEGLLKK